jgi:hypothetical protein
MGQVRHAHNILVGKPEGKRQHVQDLEIDVKIILEWILVRETRWEGVDWIHLAQDRDQ